MKKLFSLLLLYAPAQAQIRHTLSLEYTGAYFWNAAGPLAFETPLVGILQSPNYSLVKGKWGIQLGLDFYQHYYGDLEKFGASSNLYQRNYLTAHLNILYRVFERQRLELFAMAGYVHLFKAETYEGSKPFPDEGLVVGTVQVFDKSGVSAGFISRYRVWKGITLQATVQQLVIPKASDFAHISACKIGLGYTFGGGMNRSQKRLPAP